MSTCYHRPMATATTTVRLPEPLKAESEAYAASLGISLNALMAVALRDYLDGRSAGATRPGPTLSSVGPVAAASDARAPSVPVASSVSKAAAAPAPAAKYDYSQDYAAPANPKWNCPCGSKKPWLKCHGRGRK